MPGPLPEENRRRRNAPTVPTTELDPNGPSGRVPSVPEWMMLGKAGTAWWKWAWKTPQACAWGKGAGFEAFIARRASLEDDMAAISELDLPPVFEMLEQESVQDLKNLLAHLTSLATGRLAIMREMRELDDRLGLTPKGMAALRWKVKPLAAAAEPEAKPAAKGEAKVTDIASRRERLTGAS